MKILFLNPYYKPEIISSTHLGENLRSALANAGHTMELYTPYPTRGISNDVRKEYIQHHKTETELDGKLTVHRFPLYREGRNALGRALRYSILELKHLRIALKVKNVDLWPVSSTPPINGLVAVLVKKIKKIPFVFTVQDMFPESLVATGLTKKGALLYKIGNWISNITYKNAVHIVVISDSMKDTLIQKGVPAEKISVIYNWIDTESTLPVERENNDLFDELRLDRDKFYLTYAGNLGNSQNVDILLSCANALKDKEDIRFVVFGGGSEKDKFAKKIADSGLTNIALYPLQPMERVSQVYSLGDASFVTCKKGIGIGAFPSKTVSILATGTPVIASFDADSDLHRILKENEAGVCADAEDVQGAIDAILTLYNNRALCQRYGENARRLACEQFSKDVGTAAKVALFEKYAQK